MSGDLDPFGRALRSEREASRTGRETLRGEREKLHGTSAVVLSRPEPRAAAGPPPNDWSPWTGPAALVAALVLAALGGLVVDIPAVLAGVKVSSSHTPPGLELADTIVQDAMFVLTAVLFAQIGGRTVRSWQFGLRPPRPAWWRVARAVLGVYALFFLFSVIWAAALGEEPKEELLKQLGANEGDLLLALSALLTTVVAPIGEETLFRGYIFPALAKWRGWLPAAIFTGALFGAVHVGSAPVIYLVPLGVLGFLLCGLYRRTGSLYPCIATHSLNNSIAFAVLEKWSWQAVPLAAGALATIALLVLALQRIGVILPAPAGPAVPSTAYDQGDVA